VKTKLRGFLTLRANGRDAGDQPFGSRGVLARALLAADGALARYAFGAEALCAPAFRTPNRRRAASRSTTKNWRPDAGPFGGLDRASRGPDSVVIGVDDVDGSDESNACDAGASCARARELPLEPRLDLGARRQVCRR